MLAPQEFWTSTSVLQAELHFLDPKSQTLHTSPSFAYITCDVRAPYKSIQTCTCHADLVITCYTPHFTSSAHLCVLYAY